MSIFIWRLLANRIPVDAKLQWRRVNLASKCRCCARPDVETREHLFLRGEVAAEVWGKFATWFPRLPRWNDCNLDLESRIRFWHRGLRKTSKLHVSAIIPCLTLWFIWAERNNNVHRGIKMKAVSVINRVTTHLQQLITAGKLGKEEWGGCDSWEDFNTAVWVERPRKLIKLVKWNPPETGWIKLNTKGVWRQSEAGVGGTIRSSESNLIRAFTTKVVATSILDAELQALAIGLDVAREQGTRIWIEMESMEVVSMVQNHKYGPANLRYRTTHIRNKLQLLESKISYCHSSGNRAAEFLAKQGCQEESRQVFNQSTSPTMVKALVRMDQLGMPSFHFRGTGIS